MMKKAPRADDMHDPQLPTTNEDFLKPLFEVILRKKTKAETAPTNQPPIEEVQCLRATAEKEARTNISNRMEDLNVNQELGKAEEKQLS